ncbi:hypothetical protein AKO1_000082 [Acrasis kona]|uniref:EF-hand domain-containing protein n=1 Tax=Acrasis kona TaxID=1008807 RepID=A0AAW2ZGJ8_9EUKA
MNPTIHNLIHNVFGLDSDASIIDILLSITIDVRKIIRASDYLLSILFKNFADDHDQVNDEDIEQLINDLREGGLDVDSSLWMKCRMEVTPDANTTDLKTFKEVINSIISYYPHLIKVNHSCCNHNKVHHHGSIQSYKESTKLLLFPLLGLFKLNPSGSIYKDTTIIIESLQDEDVMVHIKELVLDYLFNKYDKDKDGLLNVVEFTPIWNQTNQCDQTVEQVNNILKSNHGKDTIDRELFSNFIENVMARYFSTFDM